MKSINCMDVVNNNQGENDAKDSIHSIVGMGLWEMGLLCTFTLVSSEMKKAL